MLLLANFPNSTHGLTITTTIILNIRRTLTDYNTFLQASILTSIRFLWSLSPTCPCDWKDKVWLYFLIKCPGHIKIVKHALDLKSCQLFLFSHLKFYSQLGEVLATFSYTTLFSKPLIYPRGVEQNKTKTTQMFNHQKNKNKMNCPLLCLIITIYGPLIELHARHVRLF